MSSSIICHSYFSPYTITINTINNYSVHSENWKKLQVSHMFHLPGPSWLSEDLNAELSPDEGT